MTIKQYNYSAIGIIKHDTTCQQICSLRLHLADKYLGKSAIALPIHATLVRWKSNKSQARMIQAALHDKDINMNVKIGNIELMPENRVIWYPISDVTELLELSTAIKCNLEKINVPPDKIEKKCPRFHITLAYKDYRIEQIKYIFEYAKNIPHPSNCNLVVDKVAICKQDSLGKWSYIDSTE